MHMMGEVAAQANFNQLALKKDDKSGKFLPDTAPRLPELVWRDPCSVWIASTYPGVTPPTERPSEPWLASVMLRCPTAEVR
jgi:hypothetical protein